MEISNVISYVKGSRGATPPLPYLGIRRQLAINLTVRQMNGLVLLYMWISYFKA